MALTPQEMAEKEDLEAVIIATPLCTLADWNIAYRAVATKTRVDVAESPDRVS